ncbi:MAG: hypothetical protein WBO46_22155 [Caldilineaceae bacterium]
MIYQPQPAYPTPVHAAAAAAIAERFASETDAVLLLNSCARGKASPDSCLDIGLLLRPERYAAHAPALEDDWERWYAIAPVFRALEAAGRFADVHLDVISGVYTPGERSWTDGPDSFELEIGNHLAYAHPLAQPDSYWDELRAAWLPFYGDELRGQRLAMARKFCLNNLDHIPLYSPRGLHFQCLDRLYNAHREFLQALFISRRVYPIAYDKWIHEQVVEILGLPDLYEQLLHLFQIRDLQSSEIVEKSEHLRELLNYYAPAPSESL